MAAEATGTDSFAATATGPGPTGAAAAEAAYPGPPPESALPKDAEAAVGRDSDGKAEPVASGAAPEETAGAPAGDWTTSGGESAAGGMPVEGYAW